MHLHGPWAILSSTQVNDPNSGDSNPSELSTSRAGSFRNERRIFQAWNPMVFPCFRGSQWEQVHSMKIDLICTPLDISNIHFPFVLNQSEQEKEKKKEKNSKVNLSRVGV